jgi:hypothetical protein
MTRLVLAALLAFLCTPFIACPQAPTAADGSSAEMVTADQYFADAIARNDSAKLRQLLDDRFSWTDSDGGVLRKSELIADASKARVDAQGRQARMFSADVGAVLTQHGQSHTLRVWVKRRSEWQILLYQEVTQLAAAPRAGPGRSECDNPCKTLPYEPKNDTERAVIASWQALESAVTAHDSAGWATHVSDDFMQVSSNSDHSLDKWARMKIIDEQKESGAGAAPPPLAHANFEDIGRAVIMRCLNRPPNGKPIYVTRVWIEPGDRWLLSLSFQTTQQSERSAEKIGWGAAK